MALPVGDPSEAHHEHATAPPPGRAHPRAGAARHARARSGDRADRRQHHRGRHLQPARRRSPAYGPISLVAMALTTIGALALALMFASLSRRLPADGGPYAYARAAFGNLAGFSNAWLYWITAWSGNAAIVVGWVLYVEEFVNTDQNKLFSIVLALIGLWMPAADQPQRRQGHGHGPDVDVGAEVHPAGLHVHGRAVLHRAAATSTPGTSAARATWRRSAAPWRCACSATSASRPRRSPRPRCATPTATSRGPPSSARSAPPSCTCCR